VKGEIEMPKKRALKDAARDPIAERETNTRTVKPDKPEDGYSVLTVVVAVVVGLIGGFITSRFLRIL
jgi:hypothetical protein